MTHKSTNILLWSLYSDSAHLLLFLCYLSVRIKSAWLPCRSGQRQPYDSIFSHNLHWKGRLQRGKRGNGISCTLSFLQFVDFWLKITLLTGVGKRLQASDPRTVCRPEACWVCHLCPEGHQGKTPHLNRFIQTKINLIQARTCKKHSGQERVWVENMHVEIPVIDILPSLCFYFIFPFIDISMDPNKYLLH